jgi:hypothetical protein
MVAFVNKPTIDALLNKAEQRLDELELRIGEDGLGARSFDSDELLYETLNAVKRALEYLAYELWSFLGRPTSVKERDVTFPILLAKQSGMAPDDVLRFLVSRIEKSFPGLCEARSQVFMLLISIQPVDHPLCINRLGWLPILTRDLRNVVEHRHQLKVDIHEFSVPFEDPHPEDEADLPSDVEELLMDSLYANELPTASLLFLEPNDAGELVCHETSMEGLNCDPLVFCRIAVQDSIGLASTIYSLLSDPEAKLPTS